MDNPERARILHSMTRPSDIVIVGGGLNGGALALALAQTGHSVTLIDALVEKLRRNAAFDGRSYALALASQRLLETIGIWDRVAQNAQPMLEIKVTDGHAGAGPSPFFMHFDHAEIEEGPMGYMVEDRHLRRALLDAISDEKAIARIDGKAVVSQDTNPTGVLLTLDDASTLAGQVLVGCDGRSSGTAARAGIKRTGWDYGQTALVCAIQHEQPHNGVAHQFFMPSGPLAILPLTGNRSSIVWSERTEVAEHINAMPKAEYLQVLRPRFGDFLGDIRLAGDRFTFPLNLTIANA
ncbi:MAG: FAD-dependent monooxygenase, partial [Pseudomonadota bacterium]